MLGNMFRSFLLNNRFVITFFFSLSRFSLLLSRSSNPGSHTSRLFSPPLHYVRSVPCIFYREKIFALSFLVDSRRIVATHSINRRYQKMTHFYFANKFKISPRRDSSSRTSTITSSIRGLPLLIFYRDDRIHSKHNGTTVVYI